MTEPAAVAYHGTHGFPMAQGASALVIGGGPIGLIAAQWLSIRGAGKIAVADIDPAKLEFARRLGFEAVDAGEYDIVVEACGVSATRTMAVERCARKGVLSFIGNPADDWTLPKALFSSVLRKELTMRGNWNSVPDPDWREVLTHAGKDLDLKGLITARVPMAEGAAAFARILNREGFHCKTLLVNN